MVVQDHKYTHNWHDDKQNWHNDKHVLHDDKVQVTSINGTNLSQNRTKLLNLAQVWINFGWIPQKLMSDC